MAMLIRQTAHHRNAQLGVTTVEYAILLGLVAVLGIAGLKMLGGSIDKLLGGSSVTLANSSPLSLLQPNQSQVQGVSSSSSSASSSSSSVATTAKGKGLIGSGYYAMTLDPTTGQPVMSVVDGANATATNVSSIDGSRMNTVGGLMLAKGLEALANKQTDPVLKDYFAKMAWNSYYLAGTEGELDGIPGLDANPNGPNHTTYSKGDALHDTFTYLQTLGSLMDNPPSNLNKADFLAAMPLAADAFNIAKQYQNTFSKFADANGNVAANFGVPAFCTNGGCGAGDGTPGSSLSNASKSINSPPGALGLIRIPYDQVVDYATIKATADQVLVSHTVDNLPVASTIKSAQSLNTIAVK